MREKKRKRERKKEKNPPTLSSAFARGERDRKDEKEEMKGR